MVGMLILETPAYSFEAMNIFFVKKKVKIRLYLKNGPSMNCEMASSFFGFLLSLDVGIEKLLLKKKPKNGSC